MKKLFVSFLLLFVSFVSFGQTFVIEGFEHQEIISFKNTTVDSVLMNPDLITDVNTTKLTFVVDLDNKTCRCYVSDEYLRSCPLTIVQNDDKIIIVKLIDEDNDCGIILCEDKKTFLTYWNQDGMTTIRKMIKLNISKS
jgi:hypothetical protein